MGNSDYTNAIKKLERDRSKLMAEIDLINTALDALSKLTTANITVGKPSDIAAAIYGVDSLKRVKGNGYEDYEVVIPCEYSSELPVIEMFIYAVKKMEGATALDAADFIYDLDREQDIKYLKNRFTDVASRLGRAKKLNIKKVGKKFKYFIKDEDIQKRVA
ncbi:MAG: hypothetical protein ACTHJ8_17935 [Mucilaginibacter sp.]